MDEGGMVDEDQDHDAIIDQVALECMHALEAKDKEKFMDAFHVLVGDLLSKLNSEEATEGEE